MEYVTENMVTTVGYFINSKTVHVVVGMIKKNFF